MTYRNGNKNSADVFVFYDSHHLSAGRSSVPKAERSRSQLNKYEYNNCDNNPNAENH
jgi:hypothetical protein